MFRSIMLLYKIDSFTRSFLEIDPIESFKSTFFYNITSGVSFDSGTAERGIAFKESLKLNFFPIEQSIVVTDP